MRYDHFNPEFFKENRRALTSSLEPGSIALVFGSHQMPRNGDQYYPYRQQSDFFYLTGIEQENSILLMAPDAPSDELREILFILKPNPTMEIWEGHKLTAGEASSISGIDQVQYIHNFDMTLHGLMPACEVVYFNLAENPKFKPEVHSRDYDYLHKIRQDYPLHRFGKLAPILANLRLRKHPEEIKKIREACRITHQAFLSVLEKLKPGMKEFEVEAIISYEFLKQGASGHAYPPIVASGKNACALHYTTNNATCQEGELLLMDFGAEYGNYAADLSRTIPVSGVFTPRQREVYDANLRVFRHARDLMKPGKTINEIHGQVCEMWKEEHIKLGLYTQKDFDGHQGEHPLWFRYYMHGTSHFIGLDLHDAGTRETVLEPGMVLSCEPAIYIAEEGMGIRLENDILITENGCEDLMEEIPLDPEDILDLMHTS